ncbi:MAG: ABC transporter ATP-binding protein [Bacteroidetes bacterium]|nr:ABC transporter ATP-binding protein [Bacteroidota bacterium]
MKTKLLLFARAWKYVMDSARSWTWLNLLVTLLQGILPLGFIWMMKLLVDRIAEGVSASGSRTKEEILWLTAITAGVFLLNVVSGIAGGMIRELQSVHLSDYMYGLLHKKAGELELSWFEDSRYHDLLFRASGEASFRPAKMVNGLFQLIQSLFSMGVLMGILLYLHWSIALALLVAGVPSLMFRFRHTRELYNWNREKTDRERRLSYYHRILTGEAFAREIRLFGLSAHFSNLFETLNRTLKKEKLAFLRKRTTNDILTQVFSTLVIFSVLIWAVILTLEGKMSTGTIVLYFLAFQRGAGFIRDLTNSIASLYDDQLYMKNLEEFLEIRQPRRESSAVIMKPGTDKGIVFDKVCFTYPGSERTALKDVSFVLKEDKTTALVGSNGAGKSTLVKLLCGLYLPVSGSIIVDGTDTRDWKPEDLFDRFSVLFQDFVLYYLKAGENILLGDINAAYSREKLKQAARQAGVDELIESFPAGYDTQLGRVFGGVHQLSIGEWQKLAMARAFYRQRPYLLLDEPSSSLDPQAEAFVFDRFSELTKGKTTLIVSHRMTAARKADHIMVLEKGMLLEQGNHKELLQKNGLYAAFNLSVQ